MYNLEQTTRPTTMVKKSEDLKELEELKGQLEIKDCEINYNVKYRIVSEEQLRLEMLADKYGVVILKGGEYLGDRDNLRNFFIEAEKLMLI